MAEKISGFIGTFLVAAFVLGLAESISTGFAGFWGGLPFWVISLLVLCLIIYDYWNTCLREGRSLILGLVQGISIAIFGLWGGWAYYIVALFVVAVVIYDYWNTHFRHQNLNRA